MGPCRRIYFHRWTLYYRMGLNSTTTRILVVQDIILHTHTHGKYRLARQAGHSVRGNHTMPGRPAACLLAKEHSCLRSTYTSFFGRSYSLLTAVVPYLHAMAPLPAYLGRAAPAWLNPAAQPHTLQTQNLFFSVTPDLTRIREGHFTRGLECLHLPYLLPRTVPPAFSPVALGSVWFSLCRLHSSTLLPSLPHCNAPASTNLPCTHFHHHYLLMLAPVLYTKASNSITLRHAFSHHLCSLQHGLGSLTASWAGH